jgi:peptide deformylase
MPHTERNLIMAKRNIVKVGDPVLRQKCRPVEKFDSRLHTLIDDMIDTMHFADGVGLAAPQVGILRRVVVIECVEGEILELVNPKIVAFSGTQEEQEGCLSIPGEAGITRRPKHVTVRAQDRNGNEVEYTGSDLLARAFCHELDHLDGKLYTDCAIRMLTDND